MPVAYDSVGAGNSIGGASAAALSWAQTIGGTANAIVGVCATTSTTANNVITMSCGASAMNLLLGYDFHSSSGIFYRLSLFGLLLPPTGAQTISLVNTGPGSVWWTSHGNSVAYSGVSSFGTGLSASSGGASSTALAHNNIPSATGRMVFQAFGKNTSTVVTAPNQTVRHNVAATGGGSVGTLGLAIQDAPGAGSVSFTATDTGNPVWGSIAVDLLGPAGPTPIGGKLIIGQSVQYALR